MKQYAKAMKILWEIEEILMGWESEEIDGEECTEEIHCLINNFLYLREE